MATGGTLPIKRTQTISLYNTTGIIEKEKNIYYSPFIKASATKKIRESWLDLFKVQCTSPTDYTNITISSWSPEDRRLVVRGNVDDFRLVTEYGLALNYLILTRNIYHTESTYSTYYYAFFITDVRQAGQGSVELSLEPDNFTNIFYLHNEELFTGAGYYDAFNGKLKNCYVERQHYNRVKVTETPVAGKTAVLNLYAGSLYNADEYEQGAMRITFEVPKSLFPSDFSETRPHSFVLNELEIDGLSGRPQDFSLIEIEDVLADSYLLAIDTEGDVQYPFSASEVMNLFDEAELTLTYTGISYGVVEDNLPIFSQIEESFKYKRQYRDYKEWINYGDPLTAEEKQAYEEAETWADLTSELKIKAIKLSISFLHVTLNTGLVAVDWATTGGRRLVDTIGNRYPNLDYLQERLKTIAVPLYNRISSLDKFRSNLSEIILKPKMYFYDKHNNIISRYEFNQSNHRYINPFNLSEMFLKETSPMNAYVLSAYVSKESSLIKKIIFSDDSIAFNIYEAWSPEMSGANIFSESEIEELKLIPFVNFIEVNRFSSSVAGNILTSIGKNHTTSQLRWDNPSTGECRFQINSTDVSDIDDSYDYTLTSFLEGIDKISFKINLREEINKNLKSEYYDTVLTFNPYSFYSLSYLGRIENTLNKVNYYESPNFDCELFIHVTDVFKINITPIYTIDGLKQYMYSEAIEQTLTNQITILTSKYADYLVANHAQMKNQFAVNDVRNKTELINTSVRGVGSTASSTIKGGAMGGSWGAVAGLVSGGLVTTTNLISSRITWGADTDIIQLNQKAKLSDLGTQPSNLKQTGTDVTVDLSLDELGIYLNHYRIDEVSYNSICKYLERFGYVVNIYDTLNVTSRVGWDYVKLISFDYEATINTKQEDSIRQIFANGVTLLHDKSYMTNGHNYETILEEVIL